MDDNKDKEKYEMLKKLNERLINFNDNKRNIGDNTKKEKLDDEKQEER